MTTQEFQMLELLLRKFRDEESVDREEFDKRESLRFDAEFECQARDIPLLPDTAKPVPLVEYDTLPLPDKPGTTDWLHTQLESGADVYVGIQTDHPHGGIALAHEFRHTQPDTSERTRLQFTLTPEAAGALIALYAAHGIILNENI